MRHRVASVFALVLLVALSVPAFAAGDRTDRRTGKDGSVLPADWEPAILAARQGGRFFVQLKTPAVIERGRLAPGAQRDAAAAVLRSQAGAIRQTESLGGQVVFRYSLLVNAFSAELSAEAAAALAARSDVALVERVPAVVRHNESSVPFIGAPKVWKKLDARGQGITVAVVDTGVDYTHADFDGPGTVQAYDSNDPTLIEPGTFPTNKVVGGYDFVGANYSVLDDDPSNDIPDPDPDPLDDATVGDHGTHVAGTCCGVGVPGVIGKGVAPKAKILAVKVWDDGNSSADVLVAGYEFAMDPNQDGSPSDAVDVLSFSGGVDYGPPSSVEAQAAQAVVDGGTVFVASAGNAGHQAVGGNGYVLGTPASAPGVIAVAASIDVFIANTLTVNDPAGLVLEDNGLMVHQPWSGPLDAPLTGDVVDVRGVIAPADPDGVPAPSDRFLCDTTPGGSPFAGQIALVFKGSTGEGDCDGSEKVFRAQDAGAVGAILWSGFGGFPFALSPGDFADQITIPAVMVGSANAELLAGAISPDAPGSFNTGVLNVTLNAEPAVIPGFDDRLTDFTSEGPARISSALKPDVSAPGADIMSADAGTGDQGQLLGGTSMSAPHVSGVAALLRQIHPSWSPGKIKALIMNQATQEVFNNDGSGPVAATVMGSGRVQAFESAKAESLAFPGSLSFGLQGVSDLTTIVKTFRLQNLSNHTQKYEASASVRYHENLSARFASVRIAVGDEQLATSHVFSLKAGRKAKIHVELTLDPDRVPAWQQELGWYFFNGNVDGNVDIVEKGKNGDELHVPWHVVPLAVSDTGVDPAALDLTGGPAQLAVDELGFGVGSADVYLLGAEDPAGSGAEGDLVAIGARSFTGAQIDGVPEGVPSGSDALAGIGWLDFLTSSDTPSEPIEFVAVGAGVHNITETTEVDVLVDLGADGDFADETLQADVLIVKLFEGGTGQVCVFALPNDFSACDALYFQDYSNYNASIWGIPVDAGVLGLSDGNPMFSYSIAACSGVYAGDVPDDVVCDQVGAIDPVTGTYGPTLNATDPALTLSPMVVGGFFGGDPGPVTVGVGSAGPGDDPGILAVFPNNAPEDQHTIVATTT